MRKIDLIRKIELIDIKLIEAKDDIIGMDDELLVYFGLPNTKMRYKISFQRTKNKNWQVLGNSIYHNPAFLMRKKREYSCTYCNSESHRCDFLSEYAEILIDRIKNHPSVRLRWLKHEYKDIKEKGKN